MSKIISLDDTTIKKIAAGEVVERPASVVKELIENSLDAGADKITVEISKGGIENIKIIDNGVGMNREDLLLSFRIHTTSKIQKIEDLEKLTTFGFRGEALASIASVSQTIIHSSNNIDSNEVIVENGEMVQIKAKPRSQGTTITILDIFRHLPARKKFLKSESTEFRNIYNEVLKVAIAYPEVEITMIHNNKTILNLPKTNSAPVRITQIFKNIDQADLIEIKFESPIANIHGYILSPAKITIDRTKQFLFLNKRYIQEKSIFKAIKDGYGTTISREEQPVFFLNIEINPSKIDINIHPRKLEAKIDRINELFPILVKAIHNQLNSHTHALLETKLNNFSGGYLQTNKDTTPNKTPYIQHSRENYSNTNFKTTSNNYESNTTFNFLTHEANLNKFSESEAYPIYQIFQTYIVVEKEQGLEFIDQHAADERINFEKIMKKIDEGKIIESKPLLIPIILDLDSSRYSLFEEEPELLNKFGFEVDLLGFSKLRINSIPEFSREIKYSDFIDEIINKIERSEKSKILESIAASVACHTSIRAGRKLSISEMNKLVEDLHNCETPFSCPHGRPIIWSLSKYELEKKFERK